MSSTKGRKYPKTPARRGARRKPPTGRPTPFIEKIEDLLDGGAPMAEYNRSLTNRKGSTIVNDWRAGAQPSLYAVQCLAALTDTPVAYWADDAWPVGEPHVVPMVYETPMPYRAGGQGGADFAAEAVTAARERPEVAARVLAHLAGTVARLEAEQGRSPGQVEQAVEGVLVTVLRELLPARRA